MTTDSPADRPGTDAVVPPRASGDPVPARRRDDAPLIPDRSADDSDLGWGERDRDSNDDRLLRDVPPHW